jgi:hypothetical protein
MDHSMLRAIKQLNRSFPPNLMSSIQAIQRLAATDQKWMQIASAFYGDRASEIKSPRRKWSIESDQNIPEEFKRSYRVYLNADHRQHRTRRFCDLVRSGNLAALCREFGQAHP